MTNIYVAATREKLSKKIADDLAAMLQPVPQPLICMASGDSPSGLYKEIVRKVSRNELDISNWKFVGLDEWAGMNGDDEGSCRFHLNNQFFNPLKIGADKICFFNGRAKDLSRECMDTENFIAQNGGIDVAIVGLGLNGHVGMNEPGTPAGTRAHVSQIDPLTQKTGQKYFTTPRKLSHGLTLGLANLMEADHIILIVTGAHKADIVQKILENDISEEIPATLFRKHLGFRMYLDRDAAQKIRK